MKRFLPFAFIVVLSLSARAQDIQKPLMFVEQMPQFPGGDKGLMNFLSNNIHYPVVAREGNITGTVVAQFIVEKDGTPDSIKILRSVAGGCDQEVIRVIGTMPKWKPGMQSGSAVRVYFNLPVVFSLEDDQPAAPPITPPVAKFISTGKYKNADDYIKQNTKYPSDAKKAKVAGVVSVKAILGKNGKIISAAIAQSLSSSCDKEALKVVNNMPAWMPALQNGKPIESEITLTIPFHPK